MKRSVILLLVAAAVWSASPAAADDKHTITGTFTLLDSDLSGGGRTGCSGSGGYDDIQPGLQVLVRDRRDKILAKSQLGVGHPSNDRFAAVTCIFDFKVKNVPTTAFYSIEVGRRGALTYSLKEMTKKKWRVAFSLS